MEIFEVTQEYRKKEGLSFRRFAEAINAKLVNTNVSHTLVGRWEDEQKPSEPDMRLLFECLATYEDWRAEWAASCLKAMWPDLFQRGVVRLALPVAE